MVRFLLPALLFCSLLRAERMPSRFDFLSHHGYVAGYYGNFGGHFDSLSKQIDKWAMLAGTSARPLANQYVGLCGNFNLLTAKMMTWDSNLGFGILVPQTVLKTNTQEIRFSGWHITTALLGKDLIPGDIVALVVSPGMELGSMKMKRTLNGDKNIYKNGIVSPYGRMELRFKLGPVILGGTACWRFDVSNKEWIFHSLNVPAIPDSDFKGLSYRFFIGWTYISD